MNIDFTDHYLVIRYYPRKDQIEKMSEYEATVELANRIPLNANKN